MGGTNAAAMATLFGQWFEPDACLDFPKGGSKAVVMALLRGLAPMAVNCACAAASSSAA